MLLRLEQRMNAKHLYINDLVIVFYIEIAYAYNNLKSITDCSVFKTKFVSMYCNDKGDVLDTFLGNLSCIILRKFVILC